MILSAELQEYLLAYARQKARARAEIAGKVNGKFRVMFITAENRQKGLIEYTFIIVPKAENNSNAAYTTTISIDDEKIKAILDGNPKLKSNYLLGILNAGNQ